MIPKYVGSWGPAVENVSHFLATTATRERFVIQVMIYNKVNRNPSRHFRVRVIRYTRQLAKTSDCNSSV